MKGWVGELLGNQVKVGVRYREQRREGNRPQSQ